MDQTNTPLLNGIDSPADLKKLPREKLPELAAEIRSVILDTVSITGGHLGSSMGVVELTIALHYLFDFSDDRLVFDVGHQCYPHKLLTGRRDRFHTLRQKGGLSGFTNRHESIYDAYLMGHAGTSCSAALGISIGDRILGRKRHSVAVIGDASIGCGVAFEALNHAGSLENERLLVVLNDNRWSIAKTVGALSRYLNQVRSGRFYNQAKEAMHHLIQSIPLVGKPLEQKLVDGVEMLKSMVVPGRVFEDLGFRYFGPIDGHDVGQLLSIFERVKGLDGVVLVHVLTEKGKGVPGSEDRYDRAHAAKPRPTKVPAEPAVLQPVVPPIAKGRSWTEWFGEGLIRLAEADPRIVALTAAMPDGTGLMEYRERFPDRFFDCGIAEQHAVATASGLATAGLRPVAAIYSTFLQRGYDQVFQEVVLQKLPVVFAMDRAGLVGEDGATHNGLYDIAYLRCMPGMVLMAPKDGPELQEMLAFALTLDRPVGIRYGRGIAPNGGELLGWSGERQQIRLGKMETLRQGADGAILAYGHMVQTALAAAALLDKRGIHVEVVNARFAKPVDEDGVLSVLGRHDLVVTLEDHSIHGGFGAAVLECAAARTRIRARVRVMGVPDRIIEHQSRGQALEEVGLSEEHVAAVFLEGSRVPTGR
ncbi:MAG: 1-deoxy-D-xylulose-5-phosphate synthase [Planctomycetota bacterium]